MMIAAKYGDADIRLSSGWWPRRTFIVIYSRPVSLGVKGDGNARSAWHRTRPQREGRSSISADTEMS